MTPEQELANLRTKASKLEIQLNIIANIVLKEDFDINNINRTYWTTLHDKVLELKQNQNTITIDNVDETFLGNNSDLAPIKKAFYTTAQQRILRAKEKQMEERCKPYLAQINNKLNSGRQRFDTKEIGGGDLAMQQYILELYKKAGWSIVREETFSNAYDSTKIAYRTKFIFS